jgi:hypothetical protein
MRRLATAALVLGLFLLAGGVRAADDKAKPDGTWKWTVKFGDQERTMTVKLKKDGGKLTGNFIGPDGKETAIEDGTCKDGNVSFTVTRERDGNKFVVKYNGKVEGDTIKGKAEIEAGGQTRTRDWEAKRAKD